MGEREIGGTTLSVYVKREMAEAVGEAEWDVMAVGRGGVSGRCGSVGVRARVWDSRVCVVSSRLSAGHGNVAERGREWRELAAGLAFSRSCGSGGGGGGCCNSSVGGVESVLEQDYVFWAGDLNYRVEMSGAAIREGVARQDYAGVLGRDQLSREQRAGSVLPGFQEAPVTFRPTCKYDEDNNNSNSNNNGKAPAWRDRVLWRVCKHTAAAATTTTTTNNNNHNNSDNDAHENERDGVTCLRYTAAEVGGSDHKPVSGVFLVRARAVDCGWRAARRAELVRALVTAAAEGAEELACVAVVPQRAEFGAVRSGEPRTLSVTLRNTGLGVARWRAEGVDCGSGAWVSAAPGAGTLLPGERAGVALTAAVGVPPVETTLKGAVVFRVERGPSVTVAATAECLPTCFGLSLEALVHYHSPVRAVTPTPTPTGTAGSCCTRDTLASAANRSSSSSSRSSGSGSEGKKAPRHSTGGSGGAGGGGAAARQIPLALPKEVWRMVDHIYRVGLGTPNLFARGSASDSEAEAAMECLDTGDSFERRGVSVHGVADALLRYLVSLPESVVPQRLFWECVEAGGSRAAAYAFAAERLPAVHYNVFYYLMSFAREAVGRSAENGLTPERAAAIFSSVLLRTPDLPEGRTDWACKKKTDFIMHFLTPLSPAPILSKSSTQCEQRLR